jgi:hypothetical protein
MNTPHSKSQHILRLPDGSIVCLCFASTSFLALAARALTFSKNGLVLFSCFCVITNWRASSSSLWDSSYSFIELVVDDATPYTLADDFANKLLIIDPRVGDGDAKGTGVLLLADGSFDGPFDASFFVGVVGSVFSTGLLAFLLIKPAKPPKPPCVVLPFFSASFTDFIMTFCSDSQNCVSFGERPS